MAKLKEYYGRYCESEYECAFVKFLEAEGWNYSLGNNINRVTKRDVLIEDEVKYINEMSEFMPVIVFDEIYNKQCEGKNVIKVTSWLEIYDKIKELQKSIN